jgi:hypothetical protein
MSNKSKSSAMKKFIMCLILAILPPLCFSQVGYPRILVLEGDTVIAITKQQQRNLNVLYLKHEYAQIQVDSLEKVAENCQDLIVINKKLQTTLGIKDSLINNKDSIYTQIINTKEENITKLEKKIKKRTAIGSVIGGLLVVLIIIFGVS